MTFAAETCPDCGKAYGKHSGEDWERHLREGHEVRLVETLVGGEWPLLLPEYRAARVDWDTWELAHLRSMRERLRPGDVVWDIGAEEGDFPALWASWGCYVALVEPNPLVWPNIRAIWEANDLPHPVGWFVGFAASETRQVPDSEWYAPGYAEAAGPWPACAYGPLIGNHGFLNLCERPDVSRVTVDDLAEGWEAPTALTIDVEGAELEVLRGATAVLRVCKPLVWVAVHPQFSVDMYGATREDLLLFMASQDYDGRLVAAEKHEEHWLFEPKEKAP